MSEQRRLASPAVPFRAWALGSAALLSTAYLRVLVHVVDVAGTAAGMALLVAELVLAVGLAAWLSRSVDGPRAVALGGALLAVGLLGYVATVPGALGNLEKQLSDTVTLLSGLSVLHVTRAGTWALGFAPGPVFLSWFFFLRREYAAGVVVGGAALTFFVLTGDAAVTLALVGAIGTVGVLGFGRLERVGGTVAQRDRVVAIAIAALVVTTSISLVPGDDPRPLLSDGPTPTVDGSLVGLDGRVQIQGPVRLSPEHKFTVDADRAAYWRTDAFDRYTGDGWVRTGETGPYRGLLPPPSDRTDRLRQTVEVESAAGALPAAWKPVDVSGVDASMTAEGGLRPDGTLEPGDEYAVESRRPNATTAEKRNAPAEYPGRIERRYLQLPASTPDRLERFTADLTANASGPYETAARVESYLRANKEYSLEVRRPDGDVAAAFLFDMDAGYCTYFATTMVAMLRSQGVPARFAVGYAPGEEVADGRWAVRGLDAHAWVEVYLPGVGWERFDPTPAAPRRAAERARLRDATGVDSGSIGARMGSVTPGTPTGSVASPSAANGGPSDQGGPADPSGPDAPGGGPNLPSDSALLYVAILLVGAATAINRVGLHGRLSRAVWLRRSPTGPPGARIEGAVDRFEYLMARRHRPRRENETLREYVRAVRGDRRGERLVECYERARYAGEATEADASTARELLRETLREGRPFR